MPKPGRNGFDPDKMKKYFSEIDKIQAEMLSMQGEHMARMKAKRAQISDIVDEAKDRDSIPKGAMRSVIKVRMIEARADKVRNDLDDDEQGMHDQIRQALGDFDDTPLGQAAHEAAFGSDVTAGIAKTAAE